jgi:hypothetical protein
VALRADAAQTNLCTCLSVVVLLRLAANALAVPSRPSDQGAGARIPPGKVDAGCFPDQAAACGTPDQIRRPQRHPSDICTSTPKSSNYATSPGACGKRACGV